MTETTSEPDLTKGQFIANRIRYLITMMSDAQRGHIRCMNYNPQDEIEKTEKEIAEAIDGTN